jgi:hypothetical protein
VGKDRREQAPTRLGHTALLVGIWWFIVWLIAALAATVFIQCPAAYAGDPCREVEGPSVLAGLVAWFAVLVCFGGAVTGVVALFRRGPPWPALVPILLNHRGMRWRRSRLIVLIVHSSAVLAPNWQT